MVEHRFEYVIVVEELAELDPVGVLGRVKAARAVVAEGEFEELAMAVHWVDLHAPADVAGVDAEGRRRGRGEERFVESGAAGTPLVAEFAVAEFGAVAGRTPLGGRRLLADAVNIRYRHPRLWRALAEGRGRVWQARHVVGVCLRADLDPGQVALVDGVTTPYLGSLSWSRFTALVEAKVVEADPQAAAARARTPTTWTPLTTATTLTPSPRTAATATWTPLTTAGPTTAGPTMTQAGVSRVRSPRRGRG